MGKFRVERDRSGPAVGAASWRQSEALVASRGSGPESVYAQMMATDGDTIGLEAHRSPHVVAAEPGGMGNTISEEAFDALIENVRMWLGTRMIRFHERTGRGAHHVTLEVKVSTTGALEPGGELPVKVTLDVIDGRVSLRAMGASS